MTAIGTLETKARAHLAGQGMRPDLIDWTLAQPEARRVFGLDLGGYAHPFSQKRPDYADPRSGLPTKRTAA